MHDHEHNHGHADHEHCPECGHCHHEDTPCPIPHAHDARPSALWIELREHMPFSISSVAIGLILAGVICIVGFHNLPAGAGTAPAALAQDDGHDHAGHDHAEHDHAEHDHGGHDHGGDTSIGILFFHLFHPAHMLFSAAATTAMFRRYDRKIVKAVAVGIVGSIGVCGVSDILMPQASLLMLGVHAPWHICIIEHPSLVLPFAAVGVLIGLAAAGGVVRGTIMTHSMHVFASTMASIFYMVGPMGMVEWIFRIGWVFLFVVLAVMLPCCFSDIIFPLLMSRKGHEEYLHSPHHH